MQKSVDVIIVCSSDHPGMWHCPIHSDEQRKKPTLVYVIDAMAVCLHEQISIGHYITQRTSIVAIVSEWISEIATFRTI